MLEWPDATVFEGVAGVAEDHPDRTALVFEDEETTYRELIDEGRALAAGLADLGIGSGDTIAVWLGNRPEWITTQLAASALGAAVVAVNTRYRTHELEYMLADSGATAIVTESSFLGRDYLDMLSSVVPEVETGSPETLAPDSVPSLWTVVTLEPGSLPAARSYDEVVSRGAERDAIEPATDPEAPACVFYTSGTTSDPKGCLQTNRSLLNHSFQTGAHLGVTEDDVALGALPFPGVFGFNVFLSALTHGIPLVAQPHFDPAETIRLIDEHGVTSFSAIGEMYLRLIDHDDFAPGRVETLERGAVAFVGVNDVAGALARIEDAVGFPVVQPYGLSEANSQVFVGDPDDPMERRARVGGPLVHPDEEEARIVDPETGEPLAAGEEGELCLRGYNVTAGYLGKPEQTAAAFDDDGWLHTGDLAVRDDDGYLYYRSRLDDALRVRGFLVTPRDIESAIDGHPGVELSQVVGTPHPRHGEVPVAFVKPAAGDLDEAALLAFLEDRVADYKVPERVVFVDTFPRTEGPHGRKIQKHELRERAAGLDEE